MATIQRIYTVGETKPSDTFSSYVSSYNSFEYVETVEMPSGTTTSLQNDDDDKQMKERCNYLVKSWKEK